MKPVAWLALAATLCGLAYDPHAYAAEPKRVLSLIVSCVLCVTVLVRISGEREEKRRGLAWAVRAAAAFLGLSLVSLSWGRSPGALDVATWFGGAGFALMSLRMRRLSAVALARLGALWMGGGAALVALGSAALGARGFSLHAGQGNPNWLGLLLATTLPLSLDTCMVHIRARGRARNRLLSRGGSLALLLTLAQAPALYLSHSRVAWVAATVACLLVAVCNLGARGKRAVVSVAASGLLLLALFAAGGSASADEHDTTTGDVPASQSLHGRVFLWKVSAEAARDALPFGGGLGSFPHSFHDAQGHALAKLSPSVAARTYVNATTAHQEYLQVAAESGPLAAAALVLAFLLGVVGHLRGRFFGGAGALVACMITSLGDSPLRLPAVVLVLALVLGACRARTGQASGGSVAQKVFVVTLLVLSAWVLQGSARAWASTRTYMASFDADPGARMHMLGKSARLAPSAGEPRMERGLLHLALGEPRLALVDLDVASVVLADPGILAAKGQAYLALGDTPSGERAYRAALAWNPGSVRSRVGLSRALTAQGRLDEAEAEAKIAHKLSPGSAQVRELLESIHEGRADE